MTGIAILRSEGNAKTCPLTSCFKCLAECQEGYAEYSQARLVGVFSLQSDPEEMVRLAKILKAKGAEAIHVVTCAFAHKSEGNWVLGNGLEGDLEALMKRVVAETGLPCIMGTAHLPKGYAPKRF